MAAPEAPLAYKIELNQFGRGHLLVSCSHDPNGWCRIRIKRGHPIVPPQPYDGVWRMQGTVECPNITPSINCSGCMRHFSILAGKVVMAGP